MGKHALGTMKAERVSASTLSSLEFEAICQRLPQDGQVPAPSHIASKDRFLTQLFPHSLRQNLSCWQIPILLISK